MSLSRHVYYANLLDLLAPFLAGGAVVALVVRWKVQLRIAYASASAAYVLYAGAAGHFVGTYPSLYALVWTHVLVRSSLGFPVATPAASADVGWGELIGEGIVVLTVIPSALLAVLHLIRERHGRRTHSQRT